MLREEKPVEKERIDFFFIEITFEFFNQLEGV
jgi:hypothetical protein